MKALEAIRELEGGDLHILAREKWLRHLALTGERQVNLERVQSFGDIEKNPVLEYTKRTLILLERLMPDDDNRALLEEALCWCEVAKAGMAHQRKEWLDKGCNLAVHNIGSAQIYCQEADGDPTQKHIVSVLIETHGLIGQHIRGEVPLWHNGPLHDLVREGYLTADRLRELLLTLNACIIGAVDPQLWENVRAETAELIDRIVAGALESEQTLRTRLERLRKVSISHGEDFAATYAETMSPELEKQIHALICNAALWYVEAALYDFTFAEFIKILLLVAGEAEKPSHISFEPLMRSMYYEYAGKKRVNLYKKRVIESYLAALTVQGILEGRFQKNPHVRHRVHRQVGTAFFDFVFSPAGEKLIEFCVEAEQADILYEQAILLLFDLFGLRRDKFDRFHNEEAYLETMNQAMDHKRVLLDSIVGDTALDIGPGGGGLMDLIADTYPEKKVLGIDLSQNVIDSLRKRGHLEERPWEVIYGDALHLGDSIALGSVDTIIFCAVLHELFSYIEYEGKRFNHATIAAALRSAFAILPLGGRLLIRDGIMTEPENQQRVIRFRSADGMAFLERYANDFCGREICYEVVGQNAVQMPVNAAMEFLYTYTWGEESYVHEVNEQFGYFTPSGYLAFIEDTLGPEATIVESRHFLQEGYATALASKIALFNKEGKPAALPDSTCIIVIEKHL